MRSAETAELALGVQNHEVAVEAIRLTVADMPWLEALRGQPIDEAWLEQTNDLIDEGSVRLHNSITPEDHERAVVPRLNFYGEQLGWSERGHPLHKSYLETSQERKKIVPLDTFIKTQRLLHREGVDVAEVIRKEWLVMALREETAARKIANLKAHGLEHASVIRRMPRVLGLSEDSVNQKIAVLNEAGIDPVAVINRMPNILGSATDSLATRIDLIKKTVASMGWESTAVELIESFPPILALSEDKLRVHVGILAKFGRPDMSPAYVSRLMIAPVEAHIIALHEGRKYSASSVRAVQEATSTPKRKQTVLELLETEREVIVAKLGQRTVSAYEDYRNLKAA